MTMEEMEVNSNMEGEREVWGIALADVYRFLAFEAVSGVAAKMGAENYLQGNPQIQSVVPTGKLSFLLFN